MIHRPSLTKYRSLKPESPFRLLGISNSSRSICQQQGITREAEIEIISEVERLATKIDAARRDPPEKKTNPEGDGEKNDQCADYKRHKTCRSEAVKVFQENKEFCEKFRIRLEAALAEMLVKPSNILSNTKKELQKTLTESNSSLQKRFSIARYGPNGILD